MAATATPGSDSGKITLRKVRILLAPSTEDASSRERGIASNVPIRIHPTQGKTWMRCARISPNDVSSRFQCKNTTLTGKAMATSGKVREINNEMIHRYLNGLPSLAMTDRKSVV